MPLYPNINPITMKVFYVLFICSIPIINNAQVTNVKAELVVSVEHHEAALKEINFAITKLEECDNTHSTDLMNRNAIDAKKYLYRAKRFIGYAKDEANTTEKKATEINCWEAKDQADAAKGYYYDAQREIASAISNLSSSLYKKDLNLLKQAISDANTDINRALKKMNDAVNKLNTTLVTLEKCK